ncbi:SWF or SNF family helicase [Streptomyces sp. NPDC006645]|uniref:SWF or SNF family helicase n=1 Tax=unclassified Streptomyces TaxID=2593676 RepID=UPI0033B6A840
MTGTDSGIGSGADGGRSTEGGRGTEGNERTFAALPPAHGRAFAQTWWGRAWLKALEDTALDLGQLKKGRKQARDGAVGAVSVRPGRITAVVRDRDGTAHRSDVLLQQLSTEEWDQFLDMAVERAGHIAALLDRDMPPHLVEDAAGAGVELLPGIGDLEPQCACDAWDLCLHTAALCYQVARLLDEDPFILLLMRGRGERQLLDELQVRSARAARTGRSPADGTGDEPADEPAGIRADEAFSARDILPPLPPPPPVPQEPGTPPSLDTETEPPPGIDADALEFLAADAAGRALRLLVDSLAAGHERQPLEVELTPGQDAVRLAAWCGDPLIAVRLAEGTGRQRAELDLAVEAWRHGGAAALAVLEEEWQPEPEALARVRADLAGAWEDSERPQLRAGVAGRWTVVGADAQLRYGREGRWWPYRKVRGRWVPAGPAAPDPASALSSVGVETEAGAGA